MSNNYPAQTASNCPHLKHQIVRAHELLLQSTAPSLDYLRVYCAYLYLHARIKRDTTRRLSSGITNQSLAFGKSTLTAHSSDVSAWSFIFNCNYSPGQNFELWRLPETNKALECPSMAQHVVQYRALCSLIYNFFPRNENKVFLRSAKIKCATPSIQPSSKCSASGSDQIPKFQGKPLSYSTVMSDFLKLNGNRGSVLGSLLHSAFSIRALRRPLLYH